MSPKRTDIPEPVDAAVMRRAEQWAVRFIKERVDRDKKFVLSANYELFGQDLKKGLAFGFYTGFVAGAAEGGTLKHFPQRAGRGTSPADGPGRTGAPSSRRERNRKSTPGDKLAGSPARLMRRLHDAGEKFYEDIDKI